jgi:hypothetical protein
LKCKTGKKTLALELQTSFSRVSVRIPSHYSRNAGGSNPARFRLTAGLGDATADPTPNGQIVAGDGKCLTITKGGAVGSLVALNDCEGGADQEWLLTARERSVS